MKYNIMLHYKGILWGKNIVGNGWRLETRMDSWGPQQLSGIRDEHVMGNDVDSVTAVGLFPYLKVVCPMLTHVNT